MTIRLHLFGSPAIEHGDERQALPFERRGQLLAFLALRRGWVGRAELAALLWPEQATNLAYTNLRKTLFRLQALPWAPAVESQAGALRCEASTDVSAFELALSERRLADALALRGGELLAGFDDDGNEAWTRWLAFERDRLRAAWRHAALERLAADIAPEDGIALSARLLEADPLDEAALQAHMTWLGRGGQLARARAVYREFSARLADELGLTPGSGLAALHDALGRTPPPPVSAPAAAATRDDGFVGRTAELRRITSLLAREGCRLLTLVGPGGVGKTRLARHAMRERAGGYADGVAFVPLEDIESIDDLGSRLAAELDIPLAGRAAALDQVAQFLSTREMLLVLDNFEQLESGAAVLADLLKQAPRVRLIVTSRVRLAIAPEWLLPLTGLPCPEMEDLDRADSFDAVRLFIQAAQRVDPALAPAAEAAAIVDICRQVEGLPLALELAAAWTRVLSCAAIATELRRGSELLHAVDGAQPPRHASFEVVFDQSWRLLTASEREALARLSIFRGGFAAEAARAIAEASLAVLAALADKSLLRKEGTRLFMHPLVQQLAAARLASGTARDGTARAHALYYVSLLRHETPGIEKGGREALEQVETEFENCRIAWLWCVEHEAGPALLQAAPPLAAFFKYQGRFAEGVALLERSLSLPAVCEDARLRAMLEGEVAVLEFNLERYPEAMAKAERALEAARLTRDRDAHALALQTLGSCAVRLARFQDARRFLKEGLEKARTGSYPRRVMIMQHNLALVEKLTGHYDEARRLFLESLPRHEAEGDFVGQAFCLGNLGILCSEQGDYASALAHLAAGLAVADRQGLVGAQGTLLVNLVAVSVEAGDEAAAERYGERALGIAEVTDNRNMRANLEAQFVRLALRRGDLASASAKLQASLRIAVGVDRPSLLLEGVLCFAEILAARGERACACRVLAFVAEHPRMNAPARIPVRARLRNLCPDGAPPQWPDIPLADLAHRIIVETELGYAPLIATLHATR